MTIEIRDVEVDSTRRGISLNTATGAATGLIRQRSFLSAGRVFENRCLTRMCTGRSVRAIGRMQFYSWGTAASVEPHSWMHVEEIRMSTSTACTVAEAILDQCGVMQRQLRCRLPEVWTGWRGIYRGVRQPSP